MTSSASKLARTRLDEAIRAYAASCDTPELRDAKGPFMPTGWVLIVAGIRPQFEGDDGAAYIMEAMPGQAFHAGLGLWTYGLDQARFNHQSVPVIDPEDSE